jgi:diguanylate cyclase (GGDEF)-like protein
MVGKSIVLVVDDNPDKLHLLEVALSMAGYDVRTATDGEEALAAIDSYQPDLVIADVIMPKLNGFELARRIQANPRTKFIPVILQTAARREAEDIRLSAEVGALSYITDPTDLELLLGHTRRLLDFKAHLDKAEEEAFTDHLTGLANRRRFERQLEREITRTLRYGHPFCLLMLDIDHFKNINDSYGHNAGDEAIRHLAKILQEGTRGIDLAARIGGEEFAVILTETSLKGGVEVAERLRGKLKLLEIPCGGHITASFGVAESPSCAQTADELLRCADAALYEAKHLGRDRVRCGEQAKLNSLAVGDVQ